MTQLQKLKEDKREAKEQMALARPLRGYLGNQYYYWEKQYNKISEEIRKIQNK